MTTLTRARDVLVAGHAQHVFPCAVAEVGNHAGPRTTISVGTLTYDADSPPAEDKTMFDLASLTKVLVGATLALRLVECGRLDLESRVSRWLPGFDVDDRLDVRVRDLLEHSSGLPAYRPYYQTLHGRQALEHAIAGERLGYAPRTQSTYSDLGFILVGFILEDAGEMPLAIAFDQWRDSALDVGTPLRYGPVPPDGVAPTERDPWRGRLLRGEVHDENAAALDGIAAHAGLFGTAAAVGAAARWWMGLLAGTPANGVSPSTARRFLERSTVPGSSRAIGWDTMRPSSSCGTRMSADAIGHTGFTGTSLWIDPVQDLYVVLLTNRVHPTREGDGITAVRRAFHDAVIEALESIATKERHEDHEGHEDTHSESQ